MSVSAAMSPPNISADVNSESPLTQLATRIAWIISDLKKDLESFRLLTRWHGTKLEMWVMEVCRKTSAHLRFMVECGTSAELCRVYDADLILESSIEEDMKKISLLQRRIWDDFRATDTPALHQHAEFGQIIAKILSVYAKIAEMCQLLESILDILDYARLIESQPEEGQAEKPAQNRGPSLKRLCELCRTTSILMIDDLVPATIETDEAIHRTCTVLRDFAPGLFDKGPTSLDNLYALHAQQTCGKPSEYGTYLADSFARILVFQDRWLAHYIWFQTWLMPGFGGKHQLVMLEEAKALRIEISHILAVDELLHPVVSCWAVRLPGQGVPRKYGGNSASEIQCFTSLVASLSQATDLILLERARLCCQLTGPALPYSGFVKPVRHVVEGFKESLVPTLSTFERSLQNWVEQKDVRLQTTGHKLIASLSKHRTAVETILAEADSSQGSTDGLWKEQFFACIWILYTTTIDQTFSHLEDGPWKQWFRADGVVMHMLQLLEGVPRLPNGSEVTSISRGCRL